MTTVAPEGHEQALEWPDLLRIGVVAVGAAAVWLRLWEPLPHVSVIGVLAALVIGEFFTALVIMLFVLVAEVLEGMTVARGRRAISNLLDLLPRTVTVRRNGTVRQTPAAEVRPGDL